MKILNRKGNLLLIIFYITIFLISFLVFNKACEEATSRNVKKRLEETNKQAIELAQDRIQKNLKDKLLIFSENIINSGTLKDNSLKNENIIELIKYFKTENSIPLIGLILNNQSIFLNEENKKVEFDDDVIEEILRESKNIFKFEISEEEYLVVKNTIKDNDNNDIVTIMMYNDGNEDIGLVLPIYSDIGYSFIADSLGNSLIYSSVSSAKVSVENLFDVIRSFSENNLEDVNKMKLDMMENNTGIIEYEKNESEMILYYSPIGDEDLYLFSIIPKDIIENNLDEFKLLNLIAILIIGLDVFIVFIFFTFVEKYKSKKFEKTLSLDIITNGNSYTKFQKEFQKIYDSNEKNIIYISLDIDNFKVVNTVLGKETGDYVLKKIYQILQFHIEDNGCYCRKNADEFLAYYRYKDFEDIEYIIKSISKSIRYTKLPKNYILIPSIGICYISKDMTIEDVAINANIARKKSKNKINEFYSYFENNNLNELVYDKNILDDMNNAIKNKEFRLVYQPKFNAKTKQIVGAEALIRWRKQDKTIVFPNDFIPIAEKTGFITFIDSYVFKEVCEKQAEWIKKGYNIVPISINVSREKLKNQNFLYEYLKIVGELGLEKEYVQLEITEGDTYSCDNVKTNIIDLIKNAGFKVLIDDFGVGYSSLTMLKNIKADFLKLDRSFIIDESNSGKLMIEYISKIAKIFNYRIVAEGVETEEQYNFLKDNCDEIQGYYFSKPLEEEEFIDKYLNNL